MLIYQGTKRTFSEDTEENIIADKIRDAILERMGRHTGEAEYNSWRNSMGFMYMALNDSAIPDDCGVAIEYNLPQTAKRVDFILSGYDTDGSAHANIIELKQWSEVEPVEGVDGLVHTWTGGAHRDVAHPSYQAMSYAAILRDFNESVENGNIGLHPCAYLHNYVEHRPDPIFDDKFRNYLEQAPLFTSHGLRSFRSFLKKHIAKGDNKEVLVSIDNGKIRPSKSLQDALASMLQGNQEFVLLDDQKVAYERVLLSIRKCLEDDKKRVIIIKGGPGTGKSVVAINLLVQVLQDGAIARYVSKNSAPRNVYKEMLKGRQIRYSIDALFGSSGSFTEMSENAYDVLLVDEAHRLNEKSGIFSNLGENQIKEIIHSSRCSVFFIDESQRVTIKDIGSVSEVTKWAKAANAEIEELELSSQFRCNGSDGYLAWLDNVLEIRDTANYSLDGVDYDFVVMDSPAEVEQTIKAHNGDNKARLVAGYCWEWPKEGKNDPNYHDIKIGDWSISWNLSGTQTFAIDKDSVNEAGCIHTTQGLEFDYVGVIIGDDLRYENGHIVTDFTKRAKSDQSLKGIKTMAKKNPTHAAEVADEIIKNTYRTLMTRGMKGCYVYCTDHALGEYLKERMRLAVEYDSAARH